MASVARLPARLDTAGKRLWRRITDEFVLDPREFDLLERACRQADDVARCEAVVRRDGIEASGSTGQPVVSPYLLEARQGRLAVARLLASIDIPTEHVEHDDVLSRRAARASRATRLRQQRRGRLHGAAS